MAKGKPQSLPSIYWSANDGALIWRLVEELEKYENYCILFGKVDKAEDSLQKNYTKHTKRLRQTCSGLDNPTEDANTNQYLDFYISAEGPVKDTPFQAKNLWNQIEREFPYFPCLHKIFSVRPNTIPIAVTTDMGPAGRQTVHFQPPDDDIDEEDRVIDSSLRAMSFVPIATESDPASHEPANAEPVTHTPDATVATTARVFGTDITAGAVNSAKVQTPKTPKGGPKPSTLSEKALEKA
ncbi:hypothetical protein LshimejAT787_1501380 [Lyophyllum shimeji]|uniref:Uncharacterized protein n=1 Tax=Lyophyllum shimeji TaxID=47721 RepID=A0A9P3PYJ8_LYOSH|nr:hypothetical protein LshimejAT787_1501380 [Lyophyllum shimeji]